MTRSSSIRTAWGTDVFAHASVNPGMTTKIYSYDILQESGTESAKYFIEGTVDAIIYLVNRAPLLKTGMTRGATDFSQKYTHRVAVSRFLENDPSGANYNQVIDDMQIIEALVASELGVNWNSLIDFYELNQVGNPEIVLIDKKPVWKKTDIYFGTHQSEP